MIGRGPFPPAVWPVGWNGPLPSTLVGGGGFDSGTIADVRVYHEPGSLHVRWASTAPAGSWYQVYLNGRLAWSGRRDYVDLPYKAARGSRVYVNVGSVGATNRDRDYSGSIGVPGNRAQLTWTGGRYLSPDLKGFRVYASRAPGQLVDMANRVGDVKAAPGGVWGDGYGAGPYGAGGYGADEVAYRWVSGPLASGAWQFAVAAYDAAGNEDPAPPVQDVTITIGPPEVAPRADGSRLWIAGYDAPSHTYTLAWNTTI